MQIRNQIPEGCFEITLIESDINSIKQNEDFIGPSQGRQGLGSVQFSHSVMSDTLQPHGLQHARPPCPLLFPGACSLISIELVMPSNHLILCHPHLLTSILPSIRVFSNESTLHIRWPKYWSFSFSISPSMDI